MSTPPADVKRFYDDFVEHQEAVGVNDRNRAIMTSLRRAGLRPGHSVLEIGAGIGTQTELLAREVGPSGSVLAVDLSERSIQTGRERLRRFTNVEMRTVDVIETEIEGRFDVVVLPDVIEHIPLEHHPLLFGRVARWLDGAGFALMNYPNPHYLEWCHVHRPDLLQIIDQPIHADRLLANVYPHGLYLDFLETYSIWIREGDYVTAVLRPRSAANTFTPILEAPPSLLTRALRKAKRTVLRS